MPRLSWPWLLLLLLLPVPALAQTDAAERLAALPGAQQRTELRELLVRALGEMQGETGERCPSVTGVYYAGRDSRGTTHWDLRCRGAAAFRVALTPQGEVPYVTYCPRGSGACFVPVAFSGNEAAHAAQARCNAACELQAQTARQACVARCLQGTETMATADGAGQRRHIAVYVMGAATMAEAFLVGGTDAEQVERQARLACEASSGPDMPCRRALATTNRCAAVALAEDGRSFAGLGGALVEAEHAARQSCGNAGRCEIAASGC